MRKSKRSAWGTQSKWGKTTLMRQTKNRNHIWCHCTHDRCVVSNPIKNIPHCTVTTVCEGCSHTIDHMKVLDLELVLQAEVHTVLTVALPNTHTSWTAMQIKSQNHLRWKPWTVKISSSAQQEWPWNYSKRLANSFVRLSLVLTAENWTFGAY